MIDSLKDLHRLRLGVMNQPENNLEHTLWNWISRFEPPEDPVCWCREVGLPVKEISGQVHRGPFILRSEYQEKPMSILLYPDNIRNWLIYLRQHPGLSTLTYDRLVRVCLVHEFLHHGIVHAGQYWDRATARELKRLSIPQEETLIHQVTRSWLFKTWPEYASSGDLLFP